MREDVYCTKKSEIEDAHQRYLEKQQKKAALIQDEMDARGEQAGLSMKLPSNDEYPF